METPPQFYKIRDLVLLPALNPRSQLCEETIIRYMDGFEALPPVSIQEGTGVLVDGFHRVEAATRLGAEVIPVRMLDIPDEELHLYSGLANCTHGRALNRSERNRFMVRLIEEYGWPVEKVARTVGVSPSSVSLALREHRYNVALSERLGEDVQVINSSHVQALYRVGEEQRLRLLEAVAGKMDGEGNPRPLSGAELKSLVDRMEDPLASAAELRQLLEDPLARPEVGRRRPSTEDASSGVTGEPREVERRGPLYGVDDPVPAGTDLRAELLARVLPGSSDPTSLEPGADSREYEMRGEAVWDTEGTAPRLGLADDLGRPAAGSHPPEQRSAPLGLDGDGSWENATPTADAPVALLDAMAIGDPAIPLREAERLLSDLCSQVDDAELWEQLRTARDLVREACSLLQK